MTTEQCVAIVAALLCPKVEHNSPEPEKACRDHMDESLSLAAIMVTLSEECVEQLSKDMKADKELDSREWHWVRKDAKGKAKK